MAEAAAMQIAKGVEVAHQQLSEERIRSVADSIFAHFDKDSTGTLALPELQAAADAYVQKLPGMSSQKAPESVVKKIFDMLDTKKDGVLDKEEFYTFCKTLAEHMLKPLDKLNEVIQGYAKPAAAPAPAPAPTQ